MGLFTAPESVQNLKCSNAAVPSLVLAISWRAVASSESREHNNIVGYVVNVRKLQYIDQGSGRELTSVPLIPGYYKEVNDTRANVTEGLGKHACYSLLSIIMGIQVY